MADNLNAICKLIVWKMWESRRLTTLWAFTASYRDSFSFTKLQPTSFTTKKAQFTLFGYYNKQNYRYQETASTLRILFQRSFRVRNVIWKWLDSLVTCIEFVKKTDCLERRKIHRSTRVHRPEESEKLKAFFLAKYLIAHVWKDLPAG
jgi:hypothetical protein